MDRTLTYTVSDEYSGLRISQFLRRKGFSRQNLIEFKKYSDSILLNGVPVYLNTRITGQDQINVFIHETEDSPVLPVDLPIEILYEDEDIIVVNKPAGMPTHPSVRNFDNTLANALACYYCRQNKPFVFRCTNRLDRDTSGVTVVAKHFVSGNILSEMGTRHELKRNYLAIVQGTPLPAKGTIYAPIGPAPNSPVAHCVDFSNGASAITHYQVLKSKNGHSLVSIELETGRTHQIRVHMKYLGYPLIGDYLYNPDFSLIGRQALHSRSMSFRHPITGALMTFSAEMPRDMRAIFDEPECSGA